MNNLKVKPIIGLEVHVELSTRSKMFCGCSAHHFQVKPNTHTCPVCLGLPGALPVPNKKAIDWCQLIGLALDCQLNRQSKFDRKNYFYPDLPKGYQISQYDQPLCVNGKVLLRHPDPPTGGEGSSDSLASESRKHNSASLDSSSDEYRIQNDKGMKIIRINRVHMEEDTGKLQHTTLSGEKVSLVDFNRSGVPLVEIVSEPDINSSNEAIIYLKTLQQVIRYLGVSDCDMEKGSMRIEPTVNLKIIKNNKEYYTPLVEIKNINSFRFVKKAIDYEIKRQEGEFEETGQTQRSGNKKTRGFNEQKGTTFLQREKEEASDYRYFPEPDIPPIITLQSQITKLKSQLPELPQEKLERFVKQYGLGEYYAEILTSKKETADYFEAVIKKLGTGNWKLETESVANVIVNKKINIKKLSPPQLIQKLTSQTQDQIVDEKEIEKAVKEVLSQNSKAISDYQKGKQEAIGFLIGQVMKKGKFNPQKVKGFLLSLLRKS